MSNYNYIEATDYFGRSVQIDWVEDTEVNDESLPSRGEAKLLMAASDSSDPTLKHVIKATATAGQLVLGDGTGATATAGQLVLGDGTGATATAGQSVDGAGAPIATWKLLYNSDTGANSITVSTENSAAIKPGTLVMVEHNTLKDKVIVTPVWIKSYNNEELRGEFPRQEHNSIEGLSGGARINLQYLQLTLGYRSRNFFLSVNESLTNHLNLRFSDSAGASNFTQEPVSLTPWFYKIWVLTDLPVTTQSS